MKLNLIVSTPGKWEGKTIPVTLSQFVIGRDQECHLRPASPVISKRHCAILVRAGKVFLRDFDSTNGTFVNEKQIKGEVELKNGDTLKVGPLDFNVKIEASAAAPVNKPTPPPPTKAPASPAVPAIPPAAAPAVEEPAMSKTQFLPPAANEEDDAGDMLMSILDDGSPAPRSANDPVPEGSTVMDIPVPLPNGQAPEPNKEQQDKAKAAKQLQANTSAAAKAILEKYMRRPRAT